MHVSVLIIDVCTTGGNCVVVRTTWTSACHINFCLSGSWAIEFHTRSDPAPVLPFRCLLCKLQRTQIASKRIQHKDTTPYSSYSRQLGTGQRRCFGLDADDNMLHSSNSRTIWGLNWHAWLQWKNTRN